MRRSGCLLVIVAMLALCGLVMLPVLPFFEDNSALDNLLQPLICQSGEQIERDLYTASTGRSGTSFTMSVFCVDAAGQRRDESDRWAGISLISFLVPFLVGMLLFGLGFSRMSRQMAIAVPTSTGLVLSSSLTERLQELQLARDAGLISTEEYEQLRQRALDGQT
jgi:hypothetical protein